MFWCACECRASVTTKALGSMAFQRAPRINSAHSCLSSMPTVHAHACSIHSTLTSHCPARLSAQFAAPGRFTADGRVVRAARVARSRAGFASHFFPANAQRQMLSDCLVLDTKLRVGLLLRSAASITRIIPFGSESTTLPMDVITSRVVSSTASRSRYSFSVSPGSRGGASSSVKHHTVGHQSPEVCGFWASLTIVATTRSCLLSRCGCVSLHCLGGCGRCCWRLICHRISARRLLCLFWARCLSWLQWRIADWLGLHGRGGRQQLLRRLAVLRLWLGR
jgi:hypothetical protein